MLRQLIATLALAVALAPTAMATSGNPPGTIKRGDGNLVEAYFSTFTTAGADTGTEVCALTGLTCVDTYVLDPAGSAGDELTDSACGTTQSDTVLGLVFCN